MILLNAPLPRSDPLSLGLRMSVEMQKEVQSLMALVGAASAMLPASASAWHNSATRR